MTNCGTFQINSSAMILEIMFENNVAAFMRESNMIEGERDDLMRGKLYPNDVPAALNFLRALKITKTTVKYLHVALAKPKLDSGNLTLSLCGAYRPFEVTVGKYQPPNHEDVPGLMKTYFKKLPEMNSWQAHNHFEMIHPFADLNGRVGRLIWLWKKINEEHFQFRLPFLQEYYYNTLTNFENDHAETPEKLETKNTEAPRKRKEGVE